MWLWPTPAQNLCTYRGETPVGKGALDEAFSLAWEAEQTTAKEVPFAAIFLDCSKWYERVDLDLLEQALALALDMCKGSGLAVDVLVGSLHAFLQNAP
eukprot:832759-Amphidinium_carterae.2